MINELNQRSRLIFSEIVEAFFDRGEPVGSRPLSRKLPMPLSPATIRNVMADLEDLGLLHSPHTSAGRMPTDRGLRLYIDGLLQIGELTSEERESIESQCAGAGRTLSEVLNQATETLSGMTHATGMVLAPKSEAPTRHIEFVDLSPGKALAITVLDNGLVENRLIDVPSGLLPSTLVEAANFLNARLAGRSLADTRDAIVLELADNQAELDELSARVVQTGLATLADHGGDPTFIVRGRDKLFDDVSAVADLERIRRLFEQLEHRKNILKLIDSTQGGQGVHVFIGSDSDLFDLSGCSMIVAPLQRSEQTKNGEMTTCLGAIGVIGPTRINYARIIPMVDFTAKAISRLMG